MISRTFRIGSEGEEDAGKAELALGRIGVAVRKADGTFRSFSDIIKDTSVKYKSLTNVQQTAIAQAVAGTMHYSKFMSLMSSMDIATQATAKALNSQGSAMQENAKYLDSVAGRWQILKTTLEGVQSSILNSDTLKSAISGLTGFVNTLQAVASASKIAKIELIALGIAMFSLVKYRVAVIGLFESFFVQLATGKTAIAILTGGFNALRVSLIALGRDLGAFLLQPQIAVFLAVALAIGIVTKAVIDHVNHQKDLDDQVKKTTASYKKFKDSIKNTDLGSQKEVSSDLKAQQDRLKELIKYRNELKENPTLKLTDPNYDKKVKELKELIDTLKKSGFTVNEVTGEIKEYGTAINNVNLNKSIKDTKQQTNEAIAYKNSTKNLIDTYISLSKVEKLSADQKKQISETSKTLNARLEGLILVTKKDGTVTIQNTKILGDRKTALNLEIKTLADLSKAKIESYKSQMIVEVENTQMTVKQAKARITAHQLEIDELRRQQATLQSGKKIAGTEINDDADNMRLAGLIPKAIEVKQGQINNIEKTLKALDDLINPALPKTPDAPKLPDDKNNTNNNTNKVEKVETSIEKKDKFQVAMDGIDGRVDKTNRKIKTLSTDIQNLLNQGDASSLTKALKEQGQLVDAYSSKATVLKSALTSLSGVGSQIQKDAIAKFPSLKGKDILSMSESEREELVNKMFPSKEFHDITKNVKKGKKTSKVVINSASNQKSVYDASRASLIKLLQDDITRYQTKKDELTDEAIQNAYDKIAEQTKKGEISNRILNTKEEKRLKPYTKKLQDAQDKLDLLPDAEDKVPVIKELTDSTNTYIKQLEISNKNYNAQLVNLKKMGLEGTTVWDDIKTKIEDNNSAIVEGKKNLKGFAETLKEVKSNASSAYESLQSSLVEAYRSKYEAEKESKLKDIQVLEDVQIPKKKKELEDLQDELKALQDETEEKKDKLTALKKEQEQWAKGNDALSRSKVKELEKQIKAEQKEIDIASKQKEIDTKNDELKTLEDGFAQKEKDIEDAYKILLSDTELYKKANEDLINGSYKTILETIITYNEKYKNAGTVLGKSIMDAIVLEVKQGLQASDELLGNKVRDLDSYGNDNSNSNPSNTNSSNTTSNLDEWNAHINALKNGTEDNTKYSVNPPTTSSVSKIEEILKRFKAGGQEPEFDTGGYTGTFSGGMRAILHEKELILNKTDTSNMLKLVDITRQIISGLKISSLNLPDMNARENENKVEIKQDIQVVNHTPFDVENNMDNLNTYMKVALQKSGLSMGR